MAAHKSPEDQCPARQYKTSSTTSSRPGGASEPAASNAPGDTRRLRSTAAAIFWQGHGRRSGTASSEPYRHVAGWTSPTTPRVRGRGPGRGRRRDWLRAQQVLLELLAACPDVPPPLIEQLSARGRLIAPVLEDTHQRLTHREKRAGGVRRTILSDVLYISLRAGTALEATRTPEPSHDTPEPSHEGISGLSRSLGDLLRALACVAAIVR
jgi:hypothetical protein